MELSQADLKDVDLIALCLAGDNDAWDLLLGRYRKLLQETIIDRLGPEWRDSAEVEEILSDVWLALLVENRRHLRAYDPSQSNLATYLKALTQKHCQHWRRRQARQALRLISSEGQEFIDPDSPCLAQGLWWDEFLSRLTEGERNFVLSCLASLPPGPSTRCPTSARQRKLKQRVLAKFLAVLFPE